MEGITQDTCCVSEEKESYSTSRLVGKPAIAPFSGKLVRPEASEKLKTKRRLEGKVELNISELARCQTCSMFVRPLRKTVTSRMLVKSSDKCWECGTACDSQARKQEVYLS